MYRLEKIDRKLKCPVPSRFLELSRTLDAGPLLPINYWYLTLNIDFEETVLEFVWSPESIGRWFYSFFLAIAE